MRTRVVSLLLVVASLAGCGGTDEGPLDTALFQLSVHRQKWAAEGIHNYSFDYDLTAMVYSPPVHIEVRNDLVTQVTDRNSGTVYTNSGAPTVDSLFARLETMIRNPSADVTVTYDAQLGFPAKIENAPMIADAGSTTTVSNFLQVP